MKFNNISKVDIKKVKKLARSNRQIRDARSSPLVVVDDGKDVIFNLNVDNGVWKGTRTSEMIVDHDGRKLLHWVLRKDFDETAKEIIEEQLKEMVF